MCYINPMFYRLKNHYIAYCNLPDAVSHEYKINQPLSKHDNNNVDFKHNHNHTTTKQQKTFKHEYF